MKRRDLLAAGAAVPAAVALSGCLRSSNQASGGGGGNGKKTLTVLLGDDTNIQDLWNKGLIPAFKKANPGYDISIDFDLHATHAEQNLGKLSAAVKQKKSPGYDLTDENVTQAAQANLLVKEDSSKLPALAGMPSTIIKQGYGAGVPYRASSVLLAYNTKTVPNPPKTLKDLLAWIKSHPGKFTYCTPASGGSGGAFATTVLDAYMPKNIQQEMRVKYDVSLEKYWDPGFAALRSLDPYVYQKGVYPNGNNQALDLLANGQIDMSPVWSDQFITAQKNGQIPASVHVTQISDPSFTGGANYLGVVKTSPVTDVAQKVLQYVLTPDAQTLIAKQIAGYPVIPMSKLPASVQKKFASAKPSELRPTFFGDFGTDLNNEWDKRVPK